MISQLTPGRIFYGILLFLFSYVFVYHVIYKRYCRRIMESPISP